MENKVKKNENRKIPKKVEKETLHKDQSNIIYDIKYFNKYGCVGIYNLGNTCYMNSTLQILKNIYPLTKYIILENKIKNGKIINEYTNILYNLISKNNENINISEFLNVLGKYDEYFLGYQQKDCIKSITSILSILNNDLKRKEINNNYKIINNLDKIELKFNESYNKILKRKNSIIFDIFYGFLKLTSKCENIKCNYENITFQCFNYLDLSIYDIINKKKIPNLKECIKYYEREILSEYKCEKCGNNILIKNTIYKLPKILIINFNRIYDKYHLNYLVEYPEYFNSDLYFSEKPKLLNNSLTSESTNYSLNGIIIHYGTSYSGHKTALCNNFFNNKWYYFNDSSKYKIDYLTRDILNRKDAFILVYQNKSIECKDNDIKMIKEDINRYHKLKQFDPSSNGISRFNFFIPGINKDFNINNNTYNYFKLLIKKFFK